MNNALINKTETKDKRLRKLASIGLAATVLATALGASAPALAVGCRDVKFGFVNENGVEAEINRVRYQDLDDNTTNQRTENVGNIPCPANGPCSSHGHILGSITQQRVEHELRDFQVHHRHRTGGGGWGNWHWTRVQQADREPGIANGTCQHGRFYRGLEID